MPMRSVWPGMAAIHCQIFFVSAGSSPKALYPVEERISPDIGRHITAHLLGYRAVIGQLLQDRGLKLFHAHLLIGFGEVERVLRLCR